ncbi:MAG: UDP-4-amino-4,6-dideoxy-N-acetyl-beta-L-altrosamine transaminase [Chitinispirillales bacterium]|jgi:UDP-4-amino-4,6-dideoxy-N-acetyl-beta-L-altrosamine transaminase|nr:UDP-4-amino-4,6-dideoxy-N-acetyl-beta-L-altrosamine transaminase [Chitinispirillales bacterium]
MDKFIPYGRQWIDDADIEAVERVLRSGYLTQGPEIDKFEDSIKQSVGAKYCVAVSNATQALHMSVAALEIDDGSEGITTPVTFVASANCLITNGLVPVFADIDAQTYNISPNEIEKRITPKTKVIIPVDFAGQAVDIDAIKEIAEKRKLFIVEDAAHAIGSNYADGKPVGCCHKSDMTVFSFHPVKTITSGEGGAITTNNEVLYKKLLKLRTVGITKDKQELGQDPGPWYYEMQLLGGNNRMTDIQAALGRSQMSRLNSFKKRRREIVSMYNNAFHDKPGITVPYEENGVDSCFHLYVLQMDFDKIGKSRKQVMEELRQKGIGTQVHYIPVNSQPYYVGKYGEYSPKEYPVAESYYRKCLSIPLFPMMSDEEAEYVEKNIISVGDVYE